MARANLELNLILAVLVQDQQLAAQISINPQLNWELVYKLVLRHRVWHQLYASLNNSAGLNPPWTAVPQRNALPTYTKLREFCYNDKLYLLRTAAETVRIAREFNSKQLLHCFIKGIALNVHIYHDLTSRPCRDIDLWVAPHDYQLAAELLLELGYQQHLPSYPLGGFKAAYYFKHKHDIAFYHPRHKILVELHFRLSYFGINFFPLSAELLQPLIILNTPVATLKDDYHLLYLMLHGAIHAWSRLRWLNDIALYLQAEKCNLQQVYALAEQLKAPHIVVQALILVAELLKCAVTQPAAITATPIIQKHGKQLAAIAQQFIQTDYDVNAGHGAFHKLFFVYRYYLAKLAVKGQKFNALAGDLIKIDMLFPYLTLPKRLSIFYYLLYPLWVIKYLIQAK